MRFAFFSGCTLDTRALGFKRSAMQVSDALGVELAELPTWNCCGATYPLLVDNLLDLAGPTRNLVAVAEAGEDTLVVACATCFNVLRRTNFFLSQHPDETERLNAFLERPLSYAGQVRVRHLLDVFRSEVGFDKIAARVRRRLAGLKVAAYYGCMLLRPQGEIELDSAERPRLMDDLLAALGADAVDHPHRGECCGAYLMVKEPRAAIEASHRVLASAERAGAAIVATACPVCQFNLDWAQEQMVQTYAGFRKIPVVYFTQLMGLALGLEMAGYELDRHYVDPRPALSALAQPTGAVRSS